MSMSVVLKTNKSVPGVGNKPWQRIINAAPLNASITSDYVEMKDGNVLHIWWEVTRVAGAGNGTFTITSMNGPSSASIYEETDAAITTGTNTPVVRSLVVLASSSNKRHAKLTGFAPGAKIKLAMASGVASAGASDLITMWAASSAE